MAITREFSVDELEALDLPKHFIWEEMVHQTRWYVLYDGVFIDDSGDHWRITWQRPATESQEWDPWFSEESVTATKVIELPVVVKKWVDASE